MIKWATEGDSWCTESFEKEFTDVIEMKKLFNKGRSLHAPYMITNRWLRSFDLYLTYMEMDGNVSLVGENTMARPND